MIRNRKIIFLLLFVTVSFACIGQKGQFKDTATLRKDFSRFIGKEVYTLLLSDYCRKYKYLIYIDEPPGTIRGATIGLPDGVSIDIYTKKARSLTQNEITEESWDKELLYKEIISSIIIRSKDKIILKLSSLPSPQ